MRSLFYIGLLVVGLLGACSVDRTQHRQVAQSFAEQLNRYLNEPTQANQQELANYCSSYTYSLSQNPSWAMRIVPKGKFVYGFVADSLSHDKMRAYVWFANTAAQSRSDTCCLQLRQSLDGWLVDMPLF